MAHLMAPTPDPFAGLAIHQLGELDAATKAAIAYLARYPNPNTFANYKHYLDRWFTWCAENQIAVLEAERLHVELYIRKLVASGAKTSTINAAFRPVKGFYKLAAYDDLIRKDPTVYARLPTVQYAKSARFDVFEMRRLLDAAQDIGPKHFVLVSMLMQMAMRVSEACGITVEQARHREDGFRVLEYIGKGGKPTRKPIPFQSLSAFDELIGDRTTGPLLLKVDGGQLTRNAAAGLVDTARKRAGIERHIRPHLLRKSAITLALDMGIELDDVSKGLANHADVRVTLKHYDLRGESLGSSPIHTIAARTSR